MKKRIGNHGKNKRGTRLRGPDLMVEMGFFKSVIAVRAGYWRARLRDELDSLPPVVRVGRRVMWDQVVVQRWLEQRPGVPAPREVTE